jgi:hypothetical protein
MTFILGASPSEVVYKIWISNLKNSNVVFVARWLQKKLSYTKFHNFSRSTTFVLGVSPSEVVYKIQISNLRNSNIVFMGNWLQKKLSYTKFHNFSRSMTFVLGVSPSKVVYKNQIFILYFKYLACICTYKSICRGGWILSRPYKYDYL